MKKWARRLVRKILDAATEHAANTALKNLCVICCSPMQRDVVVCDRCRGQCC